MLLDVVKYNHKVSTKTTEKCGAKQKSIKNFIQLFYLLRVL